MLIENTAGTECEAAVKPVGQTNMHAYNTKVQYEYLSYIKRVSQFPQLKEPTPGIYKEMPSHYSSSDSIIPCTTRN